MYKMKNSIFICLIFFGVQSFSQTNGALTSRRYYCNEWVMLLIGYPCRTPMISPSTLALVAEKVNQRLGYMKDVAGYKAQNHQAVEDVEQETKVIASSLSEAEGLGLDPESTRPFIIAQIDAAKAIQYRYRADWLATPEPDWQPQALDIVRQKIAVLSSEILQLFASGAQALPFRPNERIAFISQLQQINLSCADKNHLFDALLSVRFASVEE